MVIFLLAFFINGCQKETTEDKINQMLVEEQESKGSVEETSFKLPKEVLLVCLGATNQLGVVDLEKGELIKAVQVGGNPIDVIKNLDGDQAYVANSQTGDVTVVDLSLGKAVDIIPIGVTPTKMLMSRDGETLYLTDYQMNGVRVVSTELASLTKVLGLNNAGFEAREVPLACCLDPFNYPVAIGRGPVALTLSKDEDLLYVGNLATRDIALIDFATEWEIHTWDGAVGIRDMVIAGKPPKLYVAAIGSEEILVEDLLEINLETGDITKRIKVGLEPAALELSPDGKLLYVLVKSEQKISVIELEGGSVTKTCPVGPEPESIALSDDGNLIFVSDNLEGNIRVYTTDNMDLQSTIEVGINPNRMVYVNN